MKSRFAILCALLVTLGAFSVATADVPDLFLSTAEYQDAENAPPGQAFMLNQVDGYGGGTARSFDEVVGSDGNVYNGTIELTLRNADGEPIENYPFEDLTLESTNFNQTWFVCASGNAADANTNEDGKTWWQEPMLAGGYTDPLSDITRVIVSGAALEGPGFDLQFNSCDIYGDGFVALNDVSLFASDLFSGLHPFRSDFNLDGFVNLEDVPYLARALGASCPGEGK